MLLAWSNTLHNSTLWFGLACSILSVNCSRVQETAPGESTAKVDVIQFDTDILPMLKSRCFECHSDDNNDGDLRLDNEESARRGGHTGRPLFAKTAYESELYSRLISPDDELRMPKYGEPLTPEEIKRFKNWIDQGMNWGSLALTSSNSGINAQRQSESDDNSQAKSITDRIGDGLFKLDQVFQRPRYRLLNIIVGLVVGWLLLLLVTVVFKRNHREKKSAVLASTNSTEFETFSSRTRTGAISLFFRWRVLSILLFGIIGLSTILVQQGIIEELDERVRTAQSNMRRQEPIRLTTDRNSLAQPVYPLHPPRLGGLYYRGNDERSPSLFNGGVYRTATMALWLVDHNGEKVAWDSVVSDRSLAVSLTIKRAPRTATALFSEQILKETYLRRFRETDLVSENEVDESQEVPLTVVHPEQEWHVAIPLEPISEWKAGRTAGVIYLFYGSQMMDGFRGRVHYGIRYDLTVNNNQLDRESVLWMGSMYDLGGRVLVPQEKEILLDHWFDYRPLPEIEVDNPDDPELLGLPEHLKPIE